MPNLKENFCNENFEIAILFLNAKAPKNNYVIKNIYLDYGAGMMWETIVCQKQGKDEYQMLSPRDWDLIFNADNPWEVEKFINLIVKEQSCLLGLTA